MNFCSKGCLLKAGGVVYSELPVYVVLITVIDFIVSLEFGFATVSHLESSEKGVV